MAKQDEIARENITSNKTGRQLPHQTSYIEDPRDLGNRFIELLWRNDGS